MITDVAGGGMLVNYWAQFRINAIVMHFVPSQNVASVQSTALLSRIPTLGYVIDLDDVGIPGDIGLWQGRSDWHQRRFDRHVSFKFVPATAPALYDNGVVSGYGVQKKNWVRMANSSTKFYGIKYAIYGVPAGQVISFYTWYKMYITVKGLL